MIQRPSKRGKTTINMTTVCWGVSILVVLYIYYAFMTEQFKEMGHRETLFERYDHQCAKSQQEGNTVDSMQHPTLVTVGFRDWFEELRTTVGDAHLQTPHRPIVIYDIGLLKAHRSEVSKWFNVELKTFEFQSFPSFTRKIETFAWRPLVLNDALKKIDRVVYVEPGHKISEHPKAGSKIHSRGYYFGETERQHRPDNCVGKLGKNTHPCMNRERERERERGKDRE
eukprot:TRINITY_DN3365_c0_g1_i2.p1 TRINITY_DN3365_c0_g1~~TRINITY_DN3365_c0_g1_i2.p1  ORF type:complete len:226 (-),score=43.65 TRINITY_DN3365_c0_g1_i2:398-1075(-)